MVNSLFVKDKFGEIMSFENRDDVLGDITIKKHNNYFEIIFTKKYNCHVSDYEQKSCVVEHIDDRGIFNVYFIPYEKLEVKNIDELFLLLIKKPREIINILTKNDITIDRLIVEYYQD